jgi:hypothetical protein
MTPLPAGQALDRYFLDARCKLLELAAILDRVGRGQGGTGINKDPRLQKIHQALSALQDTETGRAERVQQVFSLEYDAAWPRPEPH